MLDRAFLRSKFVWFLLAIAATSVFYFINQETIAHPDTHEISGFNFISQPDEITCGPTSVLMVLQRYHKTPSLEAVKSQTKTQWFKLNGHAIGMTSPELAAAALKHFGVSVRQRAGNVELLKYYVSDDRPVIVLLRSGSTTWHYVVVIGFNEDEIIIANPSGGYREVMLLKNFISSWAFLTDMYGGSTYEKCGGCKGTGRWIDSAFGPLSICEVCGGTGRSLDYLGTLLYAANVAPMTMIIPVQKVP